MRELNESELKAVSGGATTNEYAILLQPASPTDISIDAAINPALKTKHDTAKNSIGNIR